MPDWKALEERDKKMKPVREIFGPVKNKAVTVFEDCVNYPDDQIAALVRLGREIEGAGYAGDVDIQEIQEKTERFRQMLEAIQPVPDAKPRIYLWEEGNMPALTEYTDNSDYRYNHNPDFKPYLFELLLPEDVTPKGAVVLCAGGDHGDAAVMEGYQSALDLNALGYQCFLLLNRTNHCPWSSKEAGVDAARAVRMVRDNAAKYRIAPDNIAFAGFSNGGLTGEGLFEYFSGQQKVKDVFPAYRPDALDEIDATPNAFLCVYGPRFVGDSFDYENVVYPPTFFAVGREDTAMDNLNYTYPDLLAHGVKVEVHTFAGVPHGQAGIRFMDGMVKYPNFEMWLPLADLFMQDVYAKQK